MKPNHPKLYLNSSIPPAFQVSVSCFNKVLVLYCSILGCLGIWQRNSSESVAIKSSLGRNPNRAKPNNSIRYLNSPIPQLIESFSRYFNKVLFSNFSVFEQFWILKRNSSAAMTIKSLETRPQSNLISSNCSVLWLKSLNKVNSSQVKYNSIKFLF